VSMTRAEWDALSAREKDALVAEKVMGWVRYKPKSLPPEWVIPDTNTRGLVGTVVRFADVWRPTTSWDAVREVVEKMLDRGYRTLHISHGAPHDLWYCSFFKSKDEKGAAVEAATAPEAVCIAALTSFGHMEAP